MQPASPPVVGPADNPHVWPDKAARVRRMFASVAESYDFLNHLHSAAIDHWWRSLTVRLSAVPRGGRVLDVCCGTGDLTLAYAAGAPQAARIVGSDFCHEMLVRGCDKAVGRADSRGGRVRFVEADALRLPFPDGRFDVVSCAFGLRHVADPDAALAEWFRVLAPGGRLVILEFTLPPNPVIRALYQFYFRTVMPLTATILSGDRTGAYRYLPDSVAAWRSPGDLADRMRAVGFAEVTHTLLTFGIAAIHIGCRPGDPA